MTTNNSRLSGTPTNIVGTTHAAGCVAVDACLPYALVAGQSVDLGVHTLPEATRFQSG
jgi:hypothetical protein